MPEYVDGFVLVVPRKNIPAYKKMASVAAKVWRDHGAIDYRECVAEDLSVKCGLSYKKLLGLKPSETVVFAWITYKSRKYRDKVNAAVMEDPRIRAFEGMKSMPFDVNRMSYAGFETLVK